MVYLKLMRLSCSAGRAVNASNSDITSDVNWSHSEADIALCGFLAFYCRGDMAQMDRLFRSSGLYRDKWDREQNGSTYGVITMTNAVANCKSLSGKEQTLLSVPPLRTVLDSFPSYGSSLSKSVAFAIDRLERDKILYFTMTVFMYKEILFYVIVYIFMIFCAIFQSKFFTTKGT